LGEAALVVDLVLALLVFSAVVALFVLLPVFLFKAFFFFTIGTTPRALKVTKSARRSSSSPYSPPSRSRGIFAHLSLPLFSLSLREFSLERTPLSLGCCR
jgi:hypothetical protein